MSNSQILMKINRRQKKRPKKSNSSKVLTILVIMALICNSLAFNSTQLKSLKQNPVQTVAKAMTDVIHEFYIANNIHFDFIIYGEKTPHINDVINEVTKALGTTVKVNIKHIQNIAYWFHVMKDSAIFLTKSKQNFKHFHLKAAKFDFDINMLTNEVLKRFKFLTYVEEIKNIHEIIQTLSGLQNHFDFSGVDLRFFEFFMTHNQNFVDLSANLLYSEQACGKFRQILINSFDIETQKWKKKFENFDHFNNFHGCLVPVVVKQARWYLDEMKMCKGCPTIMEEKKLLDIMRNNFNYRGLTHELMSMMEKKLNFSVHYSLHFENEGRTFGTRNFAPNIGKKYFIYNDLYDYEPEMHYSVTFGESILYYLITPNDFYTNYEKLTMPFDVTTWILLLFTYGFTFGIIFGLQRSPQWIQSIVFGQGINHPAFNALGIFFGISQLRLPREYFSRIILIIYIWFCLNIRTCYQSKMFEFMTSGMRKPLPETFDDLREMKYTIIVRNDMAKTFWMYEKEIYRGREGPIIKFVSMDNFYRLYQESVENDLSEKLAFFVYNTWHSLLNTTFIKSLAVMKYDKLVKQNAYSSRTNCVLLHSLNYFINRFHPMGITKYHTDYEVWYRARPTSPPLEDQRRILSLHDLEYGFVFYLMASIVPFIVFIYEINSLWMKRQLRKFIGLVNILRVLRARLQDYHDRW